MVVEVWIIRQAIFPAPEHDAKPFQGDQVDSCVAAFPTADLSIVMLFGPVACADAMEGPFVECLTQQFRAGPSNVSPALARVTAEEIVAQMKAAPLRLAPGAVEAASEHVLLLIPRLRMLHQQRKDIAGRIESVLNELSAEGESGEHRSVTLLLSLPGAGRVGVNP